MNQLPYGAPGQLQYGAPQVPQPPAAPRQKGFFGGLFDISFTTFVTTRVIKVLYVLYLAGLLIGLLLGLRFGLMTIVEGVSAVRDAARDLSPRGGVDRDEGTTAIVFGVVEIVATPISCIAALIYGRIMFECVAVFFRVAEHLAEINRKTKE
jgi:hypothetical protein